MKKIRKWLTLCGLLCCLGTTTALAAQNEKLPNVDLDHLREWTVTSTDTGGKLILSDSPEIVYHEGITYQDTVSGPVRLFFHHVNGTSTPKRIQVLLENKSDQEQKVYVQKYGLAGPGMNYLEVGKEAQKLYMESLDGYWVTIPAKGSAQLSDELAQMQVPYNALVNGIFDFYSENPITVKVMMVSTKSSEKEWNKQKVLKGDDTRLRGTFQNSDRLIVPVQVFRPQEDGTVAITLADHFLDTYMTGLDATDGKPSLNYGNYGVFYKIMMPSDDKAGHYQVYMNPRGGEYAGALGIKNGSDPAYTVMTPENRLYMGVKTEYDVSLAGTFKSGQKTWLTFSPPGASNLPVKLLFVPLENPS